MPCTVKSVASAKRPATMAALTAILRWPDREQPAAYIKGFCMIGNLPTSGIFRELGGTKEQSDDADADHADPEQELWGQSAVEWVDSIEVSQPRWPDVEEIYKQTQAEQVEGYCSRFYSRTELDARFGRGQWRCQRRFLISQASGKKRCIDDALRAGMNDATSMEETITTIPPDFPSLLVHALFSQVLRMWHPGIDLAKDTAELIKLLPEWLDPNMFIQDMVDAYRQVPAKPEHLPATVIAIAVWSVDRHMWQYTIMYGCPFGMSSAVLNFNRLPALSIAASRRCMGVLCGAFFDDNVGVDPAIARRSGEDGVVQVFEVVGGVLSPLGSRFRSSRRPCHRALEAVRQR